MISPTIEEIDALIKEMWSIQDEMDDKVVELLLKNKLFQICNCCQCMPVKDCSRHGCYLLRKNKINITNKR